MGGFWLILSVLIFGALIFRSVVGSVAGNLRVAGDNWEREDDKKRNGSWLQRVTDEELEEQLWNGVRAKDPTLQQELKATWSRYYDCKYPESIYMPYPTYQGTYSIQCYTGKNNQNDIDPITALRILMANRGLLLHDDATNGISTTPVPREEIYRPVVRRQQLRFLMALNDALSVNNASARIYLHRNNGALGIMCTPLNHAPAWVGERFMWEPMLSAYDIRRSAERRATEHPEWGRCAVWRSSVTNWKIERDIIKRLKENDADIVAELEESLLKYCGGEYAESNMKNMDNSVRVLLANRGLLMLSDTYVGIPISGKIGDTEEERRKNYACQERFILAIDGALRNSGIRNEMYLESPGRKKYRRFPVHHSYEYFVEEFGGDVLWEPMADKEQLP